MADINSGPGWNEAQWEKVNSAITEAFEKASVASAFIPSYGPLSNSAEYVRQETLLAPPPAPDEKLTVSVVDDETLKLFNLTVHVSLSSEQVADESLSSALLALRRAANTLAQVQDHLVFNGRGADQRKALKSLSSHPVAPPIQPGVVASGEDDVKGFINVRTAAQISKSAERLASAQSAASASVRSAGKRASAKSVSPAPSTPQNLVGQHLVAEIADAVVQLETDSHPGPFACILGADAFVAAYRPEAGSMVLPADRITPILNGPLLRSGRMPPTFGVVVSLAGSDIDLVVATPPRAQFLQMTAEAKFLFRVYEKFMVRIKDEAAIYGISI